MRLFVRIVFGLNALYQLLVGAVALAAPRVFGGLYGAPAEHLNASFLTISRGLGGFILVGAVLSALVARDPDRNPVFLPVLGLVAILTVVAWGLALATGDMTIGQAALDFVVQALILAAVAAYWKRAGKPAA